VKLETRFLRRSVRQGLVLIGCLLLAGGAQAQDARMYLGARVGHLTLEEVDDDGSFNVGVLGGLFIGQGLSAEASIDFQESDFPIDVGGISVGTPLLERKTIAFQIGLTFTPFPGKTVRPYGLGGIGHYFSEYAFGNSFQDERVSELGYYAGAGIDFMGERWRDTVSVTIDVRWMFTEKEELAASDVRADGRMFSAGFRYKF
jgi:hypothetical protein